MLKPLRFVPEDTKIGFVRHRTISYVFSGLLTVLSLALFIGWGLNYGIDFRGGTLIEIQNKAGPADLSQLRSVLGDLELGSYEIQEFGAPEEVLIRVGQQEGGEDAQQVVIDKVKAALGDTVEYRRVEVVGPKVSSELVQSGAIAVIVAIVAVLIYIWFRFEWQFAIGAIVATVHDVVLTIGIFSLLQLEFNLSIIAAILTIVGYSLNDTVVVFDRHRENLRRYKRMPLSELLDLSINQTLPRTIMTSVTTLIALLALYIFGGEVIRGFTFAMIWGVIVGTYSSIFIASPLLLILGVKRDWSGVTQGASV
jgi:preprotein translocase SecF subunit